MGDEYRASEVIISPAGVCIFAMLRVERIASDLDALHCR